MTRSGRGIGPKLVGVGAFFLLAAGVFLYFLTLSGVNLLPQALYRVRVTVPSSVALADAADVREAGVKVGQVQNIRAAGDATAITLVLVRRYGPVYQDAQVLIRDKSLAGENYVALDPGTPAAGAVPDGGQLPISSAPDATQLDQILSTLDARHRGDVRRILDVLGDGLHGRGAELNRFLGAGTALVDNAAPVAAVLAADRSHVASLTDDLGVVAQGLSARSADIQRLVGSALTAATAVASREGRLRAALAALPGFVAQARTTIGRLGTFSLDATPVMHDLRIGTELLVPAITTLGPAAAATRRAVNALGAFATVATPMAGHLRRFSGAAARLTPALEAILRQLNPLVGYLDPYAGELGSFFSGTRAATEFHDATGAYARSSASVSPASLSGVLTPAENQALQALIKAGVLGSLENVQTNPYPRPGGAAQLASFPGRYPHVQADPPYSFSKR